MTIVSEIDTQLKLTIKFHGEKKQVIIPEEGVSDQQKVVKKENEIDVEKFSLGDGNMRTKKERLEKLIAKLMDDAESFGKFQKAKPVIKRHSPRAINNMDIILF